MPRNASGTYTLPSGNPVEAGTLIEANWANTTLQDVGNELTNSLSRTGEGGMLAPFRLADGTLGAPGIAWLNEPSTGFYRYGTGEMWGVVQGTQVLQYTANGILVPTGRTFTAQGNASVGGNLTVAGTLAITGGVSFTGNATVGGTLGVTGATTLSSTLAVTGAITATGGVSGNVTGNLTGNVTGNVSGNAGTVTNGLYSTGSYADPAWLTSLAASKLTGQVAVANGGTGASTASAARANLGLVIGTDVPSPTGTGASGTWGISISGNAATATSATSASTATTATNLSGGTVSATTGTFSSTLSVSGNTTLSGGTANGVLYLNGSKVATSGSALTFDGASNFSYGGSNASTYNTLNVNNTSATGFARILFNVGSSGANGIAAIKYAPGVFMQIGPDANDTTTPLVFAVNNGSEQMRLTSTGLGVGTSSITDKLTAQGTIRTTDGTNYAQFANNFLRSYASGTFYFDNATVGQSFVYRTSSASALDTTALTLTSAGNLGLGVTPSAWSGFRALQVGGATSIWSTTSGGGSSFYSNNVYYDGTNRKRINAGYAAEYIQDSTSGGHIWYTAGTSTAGSTISFTQALTLDGSGNLGIGTSSFTARLTSKASANTYTGGALALVAAVSGTSYLTNSGGALYVSNDGSTDHLILSSGGNLGLGVTPSADWASSGYKAFVVRTAFLAGGVAPGTMVLGNNAYNDGAGWKYVATGVASYYYQNAGAHAWAYAPSGTAGNAISFTQAMTLDASGRLLVGPTSDISAGGYFGAGQFKGSYPAIVLNGTEASARQYQIGENAGALTFYDATGGTGGERARIDSSGNLLVGTTSVTTGVSGTETTLTLQGASSGKAASFVAVNNAGTGSGYLGVGTDNITYVVAKTNNALVFATNNTERARITSGGYFKLGGDTSLNRHEVWQVTAGAYTVTMGSQNGTAANCFGLQMYYSSASPNGTGNEFFLCVDNVATRMTVRSNGGIANYQANDVNLSDRREKTNFAPAKSYLETICAIPVQTFKYIDQTDDEKTLGVVAQDVQAVAPELVSESNWGTKDEPKMRLSIYQTDLQYALMKCIQELKAEVDSLKAQLKGA